MNKIRIKNMQPQQQIRMEKIGMMLKEIRFVEGKGQHEYFEHGVSRRQIQRGEYGHNMTMVKLFTIIDSYGYTLSEFFEGMV